MGAAMVVSPSKRNEQQIGSKFVCYFSSAVSVSGLFRHLLAFSSLLFFPAFLFSLLRNVQQFLLPFVFLFSF